MFGVNIFLHAVLMVRNNLATALRVSAGPMLLLLVVVLVFGTGFILTGEDMTSRMQAGTYPVFGVFLTTLTMIVTGLWVAVAWHRFVLREEVPTGLLPHFNSGATGAYIVAGIIFGLVLIAVAIPFALIAGLLFAPMAMTGGEPGLVTGFAGVLILYLPIAYVGYRISPILPSAALQARMPLKEAWYATGTSGAAFVVLTVTTVLASYLLGLPGQILPGVLAVLWAFLVQWATVLVGASILTTIYGHYVEGRALNV
jgi:hypothetical protein